MTIKKSISAFLAGAVLFVLGGCIIDDFGPNSVPCDESPLCRLQNPADTIHLDAAQKAKILTSFETMDDSTIFALTDIRFEDLKADTVRFALMNGLSVIIDSVVFRAYGVLRSDSAAVLDWRGSVGSPHQGFVDLTFHDRVYESGFAVIDGKYITLQALGATKVLVIYRPNTIWMGECPAAAKGGATALTCLPVSP